MLIQLVILHIFFFVASAKKTKTSELIQINDLKDWKKELRTKNNVLALFTKDSKKSSKLLSLLDEVSISMRGLASVISVDCTEASKLCKKLKISPKPHILNHYSNGEFNKEYDRKESTPSIENFLKDPKGDIPWIEEEAAQDVLHLDYPAFKRLLRKTEEPILVMFYAPWCGHCTRLKPEFNVAATRMKGKAILVGVDADGSKGAGVNQEYNVTSFPTILYFEKGTYQFKFTGERTKDGIVSWLQNPVPKEEKPDTGDVSWAEEDTSPVAHLSTETFKPFLAEHASVLIMFYAPWCGHCKAMKPEYSKSALLLEEYGVEGRLAAVDVTVNKELGDMFGVKGYPTVIYFKDGKKTFEHAGLRKEADIISFMKDPKEPPPPAPEEKSWSEQVNAVSHPIGSDFEKTVRRKKHSLVMFYAPWCGHCKKAKPEYSGAADQLAHNNKVLFAAVDCTDEPNKETCALYEVKSYPTIIYFSYGGSPHKYEGGRDHTSFHDAMSMDDPTTGKMTPLDITKADSADENWEGDMIVKVDKPDNFIQENYPVFMLYYKKGCSSCKGVQDAFLAAAQLLQYHRVTFAAFVCTSNAPHCAGREPAIVLHQSPTKEQVYGHSMSSSRDMYNFVSLLKDEL